MVASETLPSPKPSNVSLMRLEDLKNYSTIHWKVQQLLKSQILPTQSSGDIELQKNVENINSDSDMEVDSNADSDGNSHIKDNENLGNKTSGLILGTSISMKPVCGSSQNPSSLVPTVNIARPSYTTNTGILPTPNTPSFLSNVNIPLSYPIPPPLLPPPQSLLKGAKLLPPITEVNQTFTSKQDLIPMAVTEKPQSNPIETVLNQTSTAEIKPTPLYFGHFILMTKYTNYNKFNLKKEYFTKRRQIHLDSGIFEKADGMCHVSVYKG